MQRWLYEFTLDWRCGSTLGSVCNVGCINLLLSGAVVPRWDLYAALAVLMVSRSDFTPRPTSTLAVLILDNSLSPWFHAVICRFQTSELHSVHIWPL